MELEKAALASSDNSPEIEIDLFDLFYYILRRLKFILFAALIGVLCAAVYVFLLATPVYESTAQLYIVNSKDSALDLSDLQIGTYLTSDYQLVFQTWEVNQQVKNNLNLPYTIKDLRKMVQVTNPSDTRVLFITVSSTDSLEAAQMANEYSEVARQYIYDTMLSDMPTILSVALEPNEPVHPRPLKTTILSGFCCALLCIAIFVVAYLRDDKIKSPQDLVKYTGSMPLAVIPLTNAGHTKKRRAANPRNPRR